MKQQYIEFAVEHQVIQRTDSFFVVGGSKNYLKARFSFCDDWSEEEQIAVFTGGGHAYAVGIKDGECLVPWEVLRLKRFYVGCMAGELITSNTVAVEVCPGTISDDLEKYIEPTPTFFDEKIQKAVAQYMLNNKDHLAIILGASAPWIADVSLPASAWKGTKSPWYQVVTIPGVTENSQVDLTPDVSQLAIFHDKDIAFVAENEDGVVTVYAVGQKPTNDYVIQATIKEVL